MRTSLSLLLGALVLAAAPLGCTPEVRDFGSGGAGASTPSSSSNGSGGDPSSTAASSGESSSSGGMPAMDLYVDSKMGNDEAPGTLEMPLKTIEHALDLIAKGHTIHLFPGVYDAQSGDSFGYEVPEDVHILGGGDQNSVTLSGGSADGNGPALVFKGGGELANVYMKGFATGLHASAGPLHLGDVSIDIAPDGTGISLDGTVVVTMDGGELLNGRTGVELHTAATIIMKGTTISNMGPNCSGGVAGIYASDSAKITLDNTTISGVLGPAIDLTSASTADLVNGAHVTTSGSIGCGNSEAISVSGSATLTLTNATLDDNEGPAILAYSPVQMNITNSYLIGNGSGIHVSNGAQLFLTASDVSQNLGQGVSGGGVMQIVGTTFQSNGSDAIAVYQGGQLFLRGSQLLQNYGAIDLNTDGSQESADLGKSGDPGNNTFQSTNLNIYLAWQIAGSLVYAVGNTWTPGDQFANNEGMAIQPQLCGPAGNAGSVKNIRIINQGPCVKLQ